MIAVATENLLAPYGTQEQGWTRREAAHLLWRTQSGAGAAELDRAVEEGLERTLDRLLEPQPENETFRATEALLLRTAHDTGSIADLKAWWLYRLLHSANPLVERMTLFWHNHFATSNAKVQSVRQMGTQNALFRTHALGSFRGLLHAICRDEAMLVWLDSNANRKRHPNENFARELMELFSLDVGNYTERDIQEAARAFSGWHVRDGRFWLNEPQRDLGNKQVLGHSGNLGGDDVVDICLEQEACPRFLSLKLLREFVTAAPEPVAVDELAARIRHHDYHMGPVLRELLSSELFFSETARGALIKSPVQFVLGAHRALESRVHLEATLQALGRLGQDLFEPPTVKGWEGGRLWISSATVIQRANVATELATGTSLGAMADPEQTAAERNWKSVEDVVHHYTGLLLVRAAEPEVMQSLGDYLHQSRGSRGERFRGLIRLVLALPEYQLV